MAEISSKIRLDIISSENFPYKIPTKRPLIIVAIKGTKIPIENPHKKIAMKQA